MSTCALPFCISERRYLRRAILLDQARHVVAENRNRPAQFLHVLPFPTVHSVNRVNDADKERLRPHRTPVHLRAYLHPNRWIVAVWICRRLRVPEVGFSNHVCRYMCAPICLQFLCSKQVRSKRRMYDTSRQYQIGQSGTALEPLDFPTICTGLVQMSVPWRSGLNVRFHPHLTIGQHITITIWFEAHCFT